MATLLLKTHADLLYGTGVVLGVQQVQYVTLGLKIKHIYTDRCPTRAPNRYYCTRPTLPDTTPAHTRAPVSQSAATLAPVRVHDTRQIKGAV